MKSEDNLNSIPDLTDIITGDAKGEDRNENFSINAIRNSFSLPILINFDLESKVMLKKASSESRISERRKEIKGKGILGMKIFCFSLIVS